MDELESDKICQKVMLELAAVPNSPPHPSWFFFLQKIGFIILLQESTVGFLDFLYIEIGMNKKGCNLKLDASRAWLIRNSRNVVLGL